MNCPKCGANLTDSARFCPKCGAKIDRNPQKAIKRTTERIEEPDYREPKKKGTPVGLIAFLIILLLAIAGGGGFLAYHVISGGWGTEAPSDKNEDDKDEEEEAEQDKEREEMEEDTSAEVSEEDETQSFWSESENAAETVAQTVESAAVNTTNAWGNNPSNSTSAANAYPSEGSGYSGQSQNQNMDQVAGYILPDSSSRQLTAGDLTGLTAEQLRIARNEIYARHGRKFKDEELQAYFNSQPWYNGTVEAEQFDDMSMLSELERSNLEAIKEQEAVVNGTN